MQAFHDPLVALHEITLGLLSVDNPDSILDAILDQAIDFTHAVSGSIALLDEERKYLIIRSVRGHEKEVAEKLRLKVGEGVTGRCVMAGKTRNVGDTGQDPHYIELRSDIRSELAVPLKVGVKTFGVISVDSKDLQAFTPAHEEYLELLASYAAQIFTNQQALQNLVHRTKLQDILLAVSSLLGKYPRFEDLFSHTIRILEKGVGVNRAAVYLYDEVTNELVVAESINYTDEEIRKGHYRPGEGITGQVFVEKKVISIPDITENENFLNKTGRKRTAEKTSFFASAIVLNNNVRGVFNMEIPYDSLSHFEDYNFLVQILSSLFSQAMHIQGLIDQTSSEVHYENIVLKRQLQNEFAYENIIGKSERMQELFARMRMLADTNSSVLLVGESGTGKELIATALHQNSIRRQSPLVKINCAAIPADLLESELFGYARGAFTGATENRKGKFLLAHRGTLFLDEIGEMDPALQAKLLRVLQEKEFSPLGSEQVYKVDVRIIAATNANLEELIEKKIFREDLYYRLNVIRLEIPPLRERREDLPFLISFLLEKLARRHHKNIRGLKPEALAHLEAYSFPGNVRELENLLERAVVFSEQPWLEAADLPLPGKKTAESPASQPEAVLSFKLADFMRGRIKEAAEGSYLSEIVAPVEKELIMQMLEKTFYNKSKTARYLGINRLTLDKKIKEYGILAE